jgi:hypothetical protein
MNVWKIQGFLLGAFHIQSSSSITSSAHVVDGLKQLRIEPEFDSEKHYTGQHRVEALMAFDTDEGDPAADGMVLDRAQDLLTTLAALMAFSTGQAVRVGPGLMASLPIGDELPRERRLTKVHLTDLPASVPLPTEVLARPIDDKSLRVITWWSRGLAASDPIDQLIAMTNALDLAAGAVNGAPNRVRRCKHCGVEEDIGPGLRERIVYLLESLGFHHDRAEQIYAKRADVMHAAGDLTVEDVRRYRETADDIGEAVRRAIAQRIGVSLPPAAKTLPFDPDGALLALEVVLAADRNETGATASHEAGEGPAR